jgi:hypothetical protein
MSITKYVCAVTPTGKEGVLHQVRAERVSREPASAESLGAFFELKDGAAPPRDGVRLVAGVGSHFLSRN